MEITLREIAIKTIYTYLNFNSKLNISKSIYLPLTVYVSDYRHLIECFVSFFTLFLSNKILILFSTNRAYWVSELHSKVLAKFIVDILYIIKKSNLRYWYTYISDDLMLMNSINHSNLFFKRSYERLSLSRTLASMIRKRTANMRASSFWMLNAKH